MFLIPSHLQSHLNTLLFRKTFHEVLHRLLTNYSEFVLSSRWNLNIRKSIGRRYQEEGQTLYRIGAKVRREDWIELRTIAEALGISCCLLFTRLLELDELGWGSRLEEAGMVRTLPNHPCLLLKTQLLSRKYRIQIIYRA